MELDLETISAEEYKTGTNTYEIPVSRQWAKKYGIPRIALCCKWNRWQIKEVYITFRQSEQLKRKQILLQCNADTIMVDPRLHTQYDIMVRNCREHKATQIDIPAVLDKVTIYVGSCLMVS